MQDYIKSVMAEMPPYPVKPVEPRRNNFESVREYAVALEAYEQDIELYRTEIERYRLDQNEANNRIKNHMLMSTSIPERYWDKCWDLAWEEGHSSGYMEVWNFLQRLEDIFE